eukprot:scaffold136404_cov34-Tisochrysis_lutea.AAC.2
MGWERGGFSSGSATGGCEYLCSTWLSPCDACNLCGRARRRHASSDGERGAREGWRGSAPSYERA